MMNQQIFLMKLIISTLLAVVCFSISATGASNPGENTMISVCSSDADFALIDALNGNPDSDGEWTDPDGIVVADGLFSPAIDIQGIYTYTVSGGASATVDITIVTCTGPPANDACFSAQFVNPATGIPFSTFAASTDGLAHPGADCNVDGQGQIENDVWFLYTPSCNGTATVSTIGGTTLNTKVAVYTFACPPGSAQLLACNDDFGDSYQSQVSWEISSGAVYLIRIGESPGPGSGNGTFNLIEICEGQEPPSNQFCADAITISASPQIEFSTFNATTDGPDHSGDATCTFFGDPVIHNDIWYSFTATCQGTATMNTLGGTTLDTRIAVYAGDCPQDLSNLVACNDDYLGFSQSLVSWEIEPGEQYILRLGNSDISNGGSGTFSLIESCSDDVPANDLCSNAEIITPAQSIPFNNIQATTDGPSHFENTHCTFVGGSQIENDLWYQYIASCDGIAEVSTVGGTFLDTRLAVYAEFCPDNLLNLIACNDDDGNTQSTVQWNVVLGESYLIRLGSFPGVGGGSGTFSLTETCTEVCAMPVIGYETVCNGLDDFYGFYVNAHVITLGNQAPYMVYGDAGGDPLVISETGIYTFGPFANQASAIMMVESLNDPACTSQSYIITSDCYPDNYNNTCGDVFEAFTNQYVSYTNEASFTWGDELNGDCSFDQVYNDLWYIYTATCTGPVTWSNCALSEFQTRMVVYENSCEDGDLQVVACSESDECGVLASSLTFDAYQGGMYYLRIGSETESITGNGVFIVEQEVELVSAGADVSVSYCTDFTGSVVLQQLLEDEHPGGSWTDLDESGALLGNVLFLSNLPGDGVYQFMYTVSGDCNSDQSIVTVHYDICDNINDHSLIQSFGIFPNPASDAFFVQLPHDVRSAEMEIYHISGRLVMQSVVSESQQVAVDHLALGVYFVRFRNPENDSNEIMKLIVR